MVKVAFSKSCSCEGGATAVGILTSLTYHVYIEPQACLHRPTGSEMFCRQKPPNEQYLGKKERKIGRGREGEEEKERKRRRGRGRDTHVVGCVSNTHSTYHSTPPRSAQYTEQYIIHTRSTRFSLLSSPLLSVSPLRTM